MLINSMLGLFFYLSPFRKGASDVSGKLIRKFHRNALGAGSYEFMWDGMNDQGAPVPSGLYIYQVFGDNGKLSEPRRLIRK